MKKTFFIRKVTRAALVLTLALAVTDASFVLTASADDTNSAFTVKPAKKLSGAELYAINCNRCHAERYPTEFNSAQWQTLLTHMRVRANLPAKQAREILKYLKEESGN
jgi:cytochrome c5